MLSKLMALLAAQASLCQALSLDSTVQASLVATKDTDCTGYEEKKVAFCAQYTGDQII